MASFDYIVLGGGNSAGYVAKAFVDKGLNETNTLAIITNEAYAPYERPALSKGYLFGKANLPGFHTCAFLGAEHRAEPEWYAAHKIDLLLNTNIVEVSVATKTLKDAAGNTYVANKGLILATGSSVIQLTRNPGHDLDGIVHLRDVADGERVRAKMATAKSCVLVGGGYIGMECGAAFALQGLSVTMVFPEKHLMERLFNAEIADLYEKFYESKGVKFLKGKVCVEFVGENGKVTGVKLDDGTVVHGDMVCVGVGARPNTQLFEGQVEFGERPLGGVKVSSTLETNVPGVFAIGDIATFPLTKYNRLQRVEHVTHCRQSGTHVVDSLLGTAADYDYLPHFYSRVFDFSWVFWGDNVGEIVVVGDFAPKLAAFWVQEGKVLGVFLESGTPEEQQKAKALARDQPAVDVAQLKSLKTVEEALAHFA